MLDVSRNYGQHSKCPLCKIGDDDQKHLLECLIIKLQCPDILNNIDCKYEDIYSDNIEKQSNISKLLEIAIKRRTMLVHTDWITNQLEVPGAYITVL